MKTFLRFLVLSLLFSSSNAFAATGELALPASGVVFSNSSPLEGDTVRIRATVNNLSSLDLLGTVRILANGKSVGGDQAISALAKNSDDVFVDWTPASYGTYEIHVQVIPWDASGDDPSNNSVKKSIFIDQDTDRDNIPNNSDPDDDNDGVADADDSFPLNRSESLDSDGDGKGNNEDTDDDNDGHLDVDDQLPLNPQYYKDLDKDGLADEIDEDIDGDGLLNTAETTTDPQKWDTDGDGVNDKEDAFPTDASESKDKDRDGLGDSKDSDRDGDGTPNDQDISPDNSAPVIGLDDQSIWTNLGTLLELSSETSDAESDPLTFTWTVNGEVLSEENLKKSFAEPGIYLASLEVKDSQGQVDRFEFQIRVLGYTFYLGLFLMILSLIALAFHIIRHYNRSAKV